MGLSHLTPDQLAAWVEASCAAQGVPARVSDPAVLRRVGVLLGGLLGGLRGEGSEPPHRADPGRVQAAGTADPGPDHGVLEHGAHDGVLAVQVQPRPLVA